jgi:hypothetical protein
VFGSAFLANPDLPERFRVGAALNTPDRNTFFAPPTAQGCTDYPTLIAATAAYQRGDMGRLCKSGDSELAASFACERRGTAGGATAPAGRQGMAAT